MNNPDDKEWLNLFNQADTTFTPSEIQEYKMEQPTPKIALIIAHTKRQLVVFNNGYIYMRHPDTYQTRLFKPTKHESIETCLPLYQNYDEVDDKKQVDIYRELTKDQSKNMVPTINGPDFTNIFVDEAT